ncbi:MAG: DNA polymerase III subunit alpha, partial [Victivallales bacterium]|nr:DNA polymerase III subunit alpha [Victivallales bacterium]
TGMQDLCRRFHVSRLQDIIALIALYRPGPMQFLDEFIDRKMGKVPVIYDVPEMEPILKETYGIMLYQEQVMQVAQAVAGFTLGGADILRRAMAKKKIDKMNKIFVQFQEGARKKGHSDAIIKQVWDKIFMFSGYGFNKSHSAAYGLLSYRTAWLKANYPAEFFAAIMISELGNSEKMAFFLKEVRAMNIKVLPPDVNVCDALMSVDGPDIRFGLAAIKGVGESAVAGIIEARKNGGKFKDYNDFFERVPGLNKRLVENLIKAGALDCFGLKRSQMLAMADEAIARASSTAKDKAAGQLSLFDMMEPEDVGMMQQQVPDIEEWPLLEKLGYEKELLGFYVSGHPISQYQKTVEQFQSHALEDLASLPHNTTVRVGAYVSGVSFKTTKKDNKPWVILNLESRDAHMECLFFPDAYEAAKQDNPDIFKPETVVFIDGETSQRDEGEPMKLTGRLIYSAESMPARFAQELQIRLHEDEVTENRLEQLQKLCQDNRGSLPLIFYVHCKDGNIVALRNNENGIRLSSEFDHSLQEVVGPENLFVRIDRRPKPPKRRQWGRIAFAD